MRWPYASAMYNAPAASNVTPIGSIAADVAAMPSGDIAATPVPATVVMMPVSTATRRTRKLHVSPMKRLPTASSATLNGLHSDA